MKYKFDLTNDDEKQKSFRFYSSNLTIMTVPLSQITLISNQRISVELEFHVKSAISGEDLGESIRIILTVTDGTTFNNYLFELNVRVK